MNTAGAILATSMPIMRRSVIRVRPRSSRITIISTTPSMVRWSSIFSSGDVRWYQLMRDLARHVIDIDIYHTQEDRPAYNGGLFWHTDHYTDAATATHRSYSRANRDTQGGSRYGGGPSNEHNYTTGLLTITS